MPVVDYEGFYEVSDEGQVRSLPRTGTLGGIIKPQIDKNGYVGVRLFKAGTKTHLTVHRLVARAFLGEPGLGQECRHLNGNSSDNCLANLQWGTSKENSADLAEHGRVYQLAKTHCPQGHPYDEENTVHYRNRRYCRECNRKYTREGQRRRRAMT